MREGDMIEVANRKLSDYAGVVAAAIAKHSTGFSRCQVGPVYGGLSTLFRDNLIQKWADYYHPNFGLNIC